MAPLQSFTDFRFRKAYFNYFDGVDACYAPYIRLTNDRQIKKAQQRDILHENNIHMPVKPQLMVNNANDYLLVANHVADLGYDEINWNMGCPYPMVAKRNLGAGMLDKPDEVKKLLDEVFKLTPIRLGLKMRMGYQSTADILKIIPIVNEYPVTELIIHARFAKQLYKGGVDIERFKECISLSTTPLTFNGDINSVAIFNSMKEVFPKINSWMLGRGLVSDPFLPAMIKNNTTDYPENRLKIFRAFHDELFEDYKSVLSGDKQALMKMVSFWEYFSTSFIDSHKTYKRVKKAKSVAHYLDAVHQNFDLEEENRSI